MQWACSQTGFAAYTHGMKLNFILVSCFKKRVSVSFRLHLPETGYVKSAIALYFEIVMHTFCQLILFFTSLSPPLDFFFLVSFQNCSSSPLVKHLQDIYFEVIFEFLSFIIKVSNISKPIIKCQLWYRNNRYKYNARNELTI